MILISIVIENVLAHDHSRWNKNVAPWRHKVHVSHGDVLESHVLRTFCITMAKS